MNDIYLPEEQQTPPAKRRLPKLGKKGRVLAITAAAAVLAAAVVPRVLNRGRRGGRRPLSAGPGRAAGSVGLRLRLRHIGARRLLSGHHADLRGDP